MTSLKAEYTQSPEADPAEGNSPAHTESPPAAAISRQKSPARDGAADTTWQEEPRDER